MLKSIFLLAFFSCSFNTGKVDNKRSNSINDEVINKCKWYYYAFSSNLKLNCGVDKEVSILSCNLKLFRIDTININKVEYYFIPYLKDDNISCVYDYSKSEGISTILVDSNKYFTPEIHSVIFPDHKNKDTVLARMARAEASLMQIIAKNSNICNEWLKEYAKSKK